MVEVDLKDLETLLNATAVIKTIEGSLAQRKRDPFVQPHLDFGDAFKRLEKAMTHAKRSENAREYGTVWDEPLTYKESLLLHKTFKVTNFGTMMIVPALMRQECMEIESLAAKGCIEIGQRIEGAVWPGASAPDFRALPEYVLRPTLRGVAKLRAIEAELSAKRELTDGQQKEAGTEERRIAPPVPK